MPTAWAITVVILCVVVVIMAVIVLGLMRQVTPILERASASISGILPASGPPVGQPLPPFAAHSVDGEMASEQLRDRPHVLLFLSVGCGPCQALADELMGADLGSLADQLIIITSAEGKEELRLSDRLQVLAEQNREVSDALSVTGTPSAIAVGADGNVKATRIANTVEHLRDMAAVLV
jgi:hypothetical protein